MGSFIFPQFVIFLRHCCVIATSISSKAADRQYGDWEIRKQGNMETGKYWDKEILRQGNIETGKYSFCQRQANCAFPYYWIYFQTNFTDVDSMFCWWMTDCNPVLYEARWNVELWRGRRGRAACWQDHSSGKYWKWMTKGGGVKANADIGWQRGVGGLANAEITNKCLKMAKNMDFYPTHQDIINNVVK